MHIYIYKHIYIYIYIYTYIHTYTRTVGGKYPAQIRQAHGLTRGGRRPEVGNDKSNADLGVAIRMVRISFRIRITINDLGWQTTWGRKREE